MYHMYFAGGLFLIAELMKATKRFAPNVTSVLVVCSYA